MIQRFALLHITMTQTPSRSYSTKWMKMWENSQEEMILRPHGCQLLLMRTSGLTIDYRITMKGFVYFCTFNSQQWPDFNFSPLLPARWVILSKFLHEKNPLICTTKRDCWNVFSLLSLKPNKLHGMKFNNNSQRSGVPKQSNRATIFVLEIVVESRNISFRFGVVGRLRIGVGIKMRVAFLHTENSLKL